MLGRCVFLTSVTSVGRLRCLSGVSILMTTALMLGLVAVLPAALGQSVASAQTSFPAGAPFGCPGTVVHGSSEAADNWLQIAIPAGTTFDYTITASVVPEYDGWPVFKTRGEMLVRVDWYDAAGTRLYHDNHAFRVPESSTPPSSPVAVPAGSRTGSLTASTADRTVRLRISTRTIHAESATSTFSLAWRLGYRSTARLHGLPSSR